jgi:ribonuclease T1
MSPPLRDLRFRGGSGTIRDWNFRVASELDAVIASNPPEPGSGLSAGTNGLAVVIYEKDVAKNVDAATVQGTRAGATAMPSSRCNSTTGALLALVLAASAAFGVLVPASSQAKGAADLGVDVSLSSLPPEARRTDQLIHSGGPFPFSRDGVVFGNYEKRLEREPRGYYHEYTVPTPGARNRGARRIICGGNQPTEPDACFYTEDHYNSFHRIVK